MNLSYNIEYFLKSIRYQVSHLRHGKELRLNQEKQKDYSLSGFREHKCIFIHIPKTAGISVNKALFGSQGGGHKDVVFYKRAFGPLTYRNYFTFTFVRNPYSRLLSAYTFLKRGGFGEKDRRWADQHLLEINCFEQFVFEWLNKETMYSYIHFIPQVNFVCDINLTPDVDFIGRFESLEADFQIVADRLGLQVSLPMLNKTSKKSWKECYTLASKEKVSKLYRDDFKTFGYSTDLK